MKNILPVVLMMSLFVNKSYTQEENQYESMDKSMDKSMQENVLGELSTEPTIDNLSIGKIIESYQADLGQKEYISKTIGKVVRALTKADAKVLELNKEGKSPFRSDLVKAAVNVIYECNLAGEDLNNGLINAREFGENGGQDNPVDLLNYVNTNLNVYKSDNCDGSVADLIDEFNKAS